MKIKIKRALISVYDKSNILDLALFLARNGVEIISTGKTYSFLKKNGIESIDVSSYTGYPEIFDGRVKTLHPKIFGGILAVENNFLHIKDKEKNDIKNIDLVVVNLYPFADVAANKMSSSDDIIENIDIGGVSLIRAAAKNFMHVVVLTSPNQYSDLMIETDSNFRKNLAKKAFALSMHYDSQIYNWFSDENLLNGELMLLSGKKLLDFRYGENPHQKSSFFHNESLPFEQLQGKSLSYNNILDLDVGIDIVNEFNEPTACIIKHNNPCGAASSKNILSAYKNAFKCDPTSSFGGIVVINDKITSEIAAEIVKTFIEVLAAPSINEDAKKILTQKPNMRVLIYSKSKNKYTARTALGGILLQEENTIMLDKNHYDVVGKTKPSNDAIEQLMFAWKICKYVKSNAIVIVKDHQTVSIGAGQTSRIDSVNIAIQKAGKHSEGAFLASDGFFPFADSIKAAHNAGIIGIIEPGGSIRDNEVIQEANQSGMPLLFTNIRHFRH